MQMIEELIHNYPQLHKVKEQIILAFEIMRQCYSDKKKLLLCGNGGSAADCEHIVGELMKEFCITRAIPNAFAEQLRQYGADEIMIKSIVGALPAISLTSHISFQTAFCNDNHAENMFAQHLYALGEPGDTLLAITTSGNSQNIINAAIIAKAMNIKIIALTGSNGGKIRLYADALINVPEVDTARVQELHLPIYHALCKMLEDYFF